MNFIKNHFQKLIKNQLVAGSTILFAGNMFASFGNYLYHLLMGRMLGPTNYGVLASLISLTYLFNIPIGTLSLVVVKYISELRGKKELDKIAYFYSWLNNKLILYGFAGFFLLIIASPLFVSFLHLDSILPLLLMIVCSLIAVFLSVNNATLQGFLCFGWMSVLGIIQAILKVGTAVLLVLAGLKVLGAVSSILVASLIGLVLACLLVKRLLKKREIKEKISTQEIFKYAVPVFFSNLAFTSLYTSDIVLVKHFLFAQEAGFYAALAVLGKIIFFASSPIIMVMFPMVSERHANGKKYHSLLNLSFVLVFLITLGIGLIYFLFPELMVNILYGAEYLPAASYLVFFAIFLGLYSFSFLFTNFFLSIRKTKIVILPVLAAIAQIVLISIFHQDLIQIIRVSIGVLFLLFVSLLFYNFATIRKSK